MSEISKKTQKLSAAIYLITGFFDDKEPLRWKLRSLATNLVSEISKDKLLLVREAISLFALAKNVGLVSDLNHSILARELAKFKQEIENPLDSTSFLEFSISERHVPSLAPRAESLENIKDKNIEQERSAKRTLLPEVSSKPLKEFGAVSVKKNSRQSVIIGLLKRKKEIMIKDVSPLISGCSEKTIQRELLTMVSQGILKKIGEKRWSRYTLAA